MIWSCTCGLARGSSCGSRDVRGGSFGIGIGSDPESQMIEPAAIARVLQRVEAPARRDLVAAAVGGDRTMDRDAERPGLDERGQLGHLPVAERDVDEHRLGGCARAAGRS